MPLLIPSKFINSSLKTLPLKKPIFIPLKTKVKIKGANYVVNENGIPCCPHDSSLLMKREGSRPHLRCGLPTMKFVCPKMNWK